MPRTYKRKPGAKAHQLIDKEILAKAVQAVKDGKLTYRNAAKSYNLTPSAVYNHWKKPPLKSQGGQPVLDAEIENMLVKNLLKCAEWGYPLNKSEMCRVIKRKCPNIDPNA